MWLFFFFSQGSLDDPSLSWSSFLSCALAALQILKYSSRPLSIPLSLSVSLPVAIAPF